MTAEARIKGGWLAFTVLEEGAIRTIPAAGGLGPIPLFQSEPVSLRGQSNLYARIKYAADEFCVRYQRTARFGRFYVAPPPVRMAYLDRVNEFRYGGRRSGKLTCNRDGHTRSVHDKVFDITVIETEWEDSEPYTEVA